MQASLVVGISGGNLHGLPTWSEAPKGSNADVLEQLKRQGYEATQGFGSPDECKSAGVIPLAGGRIDRPDQALTLAQLHQDQGWVCTTLHVGNGFESDDEVDALIEAINQATVKTAYPLYIETHRATITQDIARTVRFTNKFPDVRFNADFSHWYTGLEMPYAGVKEAIAYAKPVMDRVKFMHGRIGNPSCMQVPLTGPDDESSYVQDFRLLWTAAMGGFVSHANNGEVLYFVSELLGPFYAQLDPQSGEEPSDRFIQSGYLIQIARECFHQARQLSRP
jgi:hypothetical protein